MVPKVHVEDIEKQKLIGVGSFGRFYEGKWRTLTVVIKDVPEAVENLPFIKEVEQLSSVLHPNIVRIYGTCSRKQSFYIVMEYADCGSLQQTLHGREPVFVYSNVHALSWARQCAEGITFLHAMKPRPMIHRDIKPAKLLLFENKTKLKIVHFGTVREKSSVMTIGTGSAAYMAPEVFSTPSYNEKCDVYSWAIVLWEILVRQQPFKEHESYYAIMFNTHNGQRPSIDQENLTEPLKALLIQCWQQDPELRPAMKSVANTLTSLCNELTGGSGQVPATALTAYI